MAKKTINFLIGVMIAGLLAGLVAGRLELDRVDVHPDASWLPSIWLAQCAVAVWLGLTIWLIAEVASHRFRSIPASPYRRRLAGAVLGGLVGFFVIGMLLPCVSHGTPHGFAGGCGRFMEERVQTWQSELPTDRYPAATMAELYAAWLQNPPTDWSDEKRSAQSWRGSLEEYQALSSYRNRLDFERLPNEDELAYRYCGEGVSFSDKDAIIFYEKPGLHAKAGDIRHVVYANGRVEKVPRSDWPRIAARIERQQTHLQTTISAK